MSTEFSRVERGLLIIALLLIIIIAMRTISFIVTLFLMSLVLTLLTLPAMLWLKKKGLSDFLATLVITGVAILIILGFVFFTLLSFNSLVASLPQYQNELDMRLHDITAVLNAYGITTTTDGIPSIKLGDVMGYGFTGLVSAAEAVEFIFFVGVTTFFILLDSSRISAIMEARFGKDSETMRQLNCLTGYVIDFIVVRTETNFIHGVLFGGFLGIIGVHGAILWGVLTFLLGYIPFIGLIIAAIPALLFAWLQFGIVVISVIFWGWLLGLVGMLFSVPFTLLVLLLFQVVEEFRWINAALGVNHLFEDKKTL
jgi:AI-2 transport protein TqsA